MKDRIIISGQNFEFAGYAAIGCPRFVHVGSGIAFQYVSGGSFMMGFSEAEEHAAFSISDVPQLTVEEMRPVRRRVVHPMLVSVAPVLNFQCSDEKSEFPYGPAYLSREDAERFASGIGCRMPGEAEWEYICRAGTQTLFPFGDNLPSEDVLEKWLSSDFTSLIAYFESRPNFEPVPDLQCNAFGLYGMTNPEWCLNRFTTSLAPNAPQLDGGYVVRGGGAYFWPWQDEEWMWCVSAMRSPSSGLEEGLACLRLVLNVRASQLHAEIRHAGFDLPADSREDDSSRDELNGESN
ncbi:SUMF1/EgtB/PvdO family nonheme iron enzyme [Burkholderia aenigmatica]|uniref:formylglycine-generating enzyme family protein n=1 Tax=Burkholderia aenigmatica TaxID=2015348 RepID=UPI001F2889E3|nr:SUMF1/EgtB/PvdO family nonheme iron enzyme [Burkholderia aenigmatica]UKD13711.1 SUMF1/EgtB/PvdO family nonheme iron enzyme [Burkholderia aenigmatica]